MKTTIFIISILIINTLTIKAQGLFGRTYKKGYYYNKNNEKIEGLVSFFAYSNSFYYKKNEDAKWEKIKIENIKSIVSTERTVYYESGFNSKKTLEKYIDSFSVKSVNKEGKNLYLAKLVLSSPDIKIW
ncbi:hypothetical protein [Pedobacter sp. ASV28]|uniref:hypothetical protein n=1 Tax=Pedobacter sp. ASV28 TaxID=2795123 RepID=UPI0018EACE2C|nr:hypothetical protein [Pedobacter sp. ASV28]